MPKQLLLSKVPVELSIVEFNLDDQEDIFLTYTWGLRRGPGIRRTGQGPPYMDSIGGHHMEFTTHPFVLRLRTWLIQEEMRAAEIAEAQGELAKAQASKNQDDIKILNRAKKELRDIQAHDEFFQNVYPGYEIIGLQGCGDLTMNEWNVGFLNNELGEDRPTLVCLRTEELRYRTYSCLVKWKPSESRRGQLTIEDLRFNYEEIAQESNNIVRVRFGDAWLPRGDLIDFAVSNQQVIREGQIVPVTTICNQFSDLRHLLMLPNLNPKGPLHSGETSRPDGGYRPRQYFGREQPEDIWLGEADFLRDINLLRAALSGPVFIPFPPGATRLSLRGALKQVGYQEVLSDLEPLSPGGWRFVERSPTEEVLEVYFKRNTYGWTMIGLSSDNRRLLCLACTGQAGRTGYTLEQAADFLLQAGARNALLVDEGNDVFQRVRWDGGDMLDMIPSKRRRLRSIFIFARPRFGFGCRPSPPSEEDIKFAP
jgi:hypothetical protein